MSTEAERTIDTEADYADADSDPNAYFKRVVDAVTGEEIQGVVEANAVDGWFYQYATTGDGRELTERFINDRGQVDMRKVRYRVEKPIAILYKPEAPASLRGEEFRLK